MQPEPSFYAKATTWVVNLLGSHPWIIPVVLVAVLVTNGMRTRWPERTARPGWVLFVLGFTDPITGNFWGLIRLVSTKTGIPIWSPKNDSGEVALPDKPIPQASIDRAEAPKP